MYVCSYTSCLCVQISLLNPEEARFSSLISGVMALKVSSPNLVTCSRTRGCNICFGEADRASIRVAMEEGEVGLGGSHRAEFREGMPWLSGLGFTL